MFSSRKSPPVVIDLRNHRDDYEWLDTHLNEIHHEIRHKLESNPQAGEALEMLILVMPYAITRKDYLRWEPLLYNGLQHAMILRDNDFLIQLWANLGESHFQIGRYHTATEAFRAALKRADRCNEVEDILLARIGLLKSATFFNMDDVDQFIADTLALAQSVHNLRLIARIHYTLAVAYTNRAETVKALGHAQTAYACWYRLGNTFEKNRSALIAAEACRVALRFEQALHYLQVAQENFAQNYDEALYDYQRGVILLEMGALEEARHWLTQALENCVKLDRPYMTGAARHALGLLFIRLDEYKEAYRHLRQALVTWQKTENRYQQAELVYALGYWHQRQAENNQAQALYRDALVLSQSAVVSPLLNDLRKRIQDDLDQLAHHPQDHAQNA